MADGRGFVRSTASVLLLLGTGLGLYNVYGDNAAVHALAEKTACSDRPCTAKVTRESRSPIAQSFTYQIELTGSGKAKRSASVDVECKRAAVLLGDYACMAQGALP